MPALQTFAASVDCALAITQPDRPAGRGHRLQATPVKRAARELGIATLEPVRMREAAEAIAGLRPDLFAVASYGRILPQALLDLAPRGALNVHPSLLPLYRGATPLQSQLRDGVRSSGVTIIFMDAGMDTGDIVLVERSEIGPRETYGELHDRFAELGATLLARACALVVAGAATRTPQAGLQSERDVTQTRTRPFGKADLVVDWAWPARRIVDHVRAFAPAPGARGTLPGEEQPVKLLSVHAAAADEPGVLSVPCGRGEFVVVDELVAPGRTVTSGRAYRAARAAR